MQYIIHLLIFIAFYTMLAQSLNLASGYTGLISLAHAGFFGIGAYTTSLLSINYGTSFLLNIPIAMTLCGVIACIVSLISFRTVDDYFIVSTLGIQVIIFSLMNNLTDITKGPFGIPGIPAISLFGIELSNKFSFLLLGVIFAILIWYILHNVSKSGFGKSLISISEDEIYSQSIGKNVRNLKVISFTLSAMFAAIPGVLFAHYISYIDPSSFTIGESIFILSIVIIGGLGNLKGSFYASVFMVLLPEALRFVGIPNSIAANVRQIIYGLLLVFVILKSENGLRIIKRKSRNL